jgi:hypothetical protein
MTRKRCEGRVGETQNVKRGRYTLNCAHNSRMTPILQCIWYIHFVPNRARPEVLIQLKLIITVTSSRWFYYVWGSRPIYGYIWRYIFYGFEPVFSVFFPAGFWVLLLPSLAVDFNSRLDKFSTPIHLQINTELPILVAARLLRLRVRIPPASG